ncbi:MULTISPECIES: hypothetical protein [unclassified Bradyrhizobium]|uniref:hypothetical protein n=1 Tax=Bradyrhizobium sp. USDA 4541 TaxID=2817704 RepID=UPI0020A31C52|nr:hypothetical protein [Bradyrhizobium sp. USDA 4541]MCP1848394.1 hypothetical protein [Bradyrhizobium sp. USDA 4541]
MQFSNWVKFNDRDQLKGTSYPGIYAIAISRANITGTRFRWVKNIAYFGFTNAAGGLRGRLNQFNNTLRESRPGHGGAQRFRRKYPDGDALAKRLYVAVCAFECNVSTNKPADLRVMGDVVRAEYLAFAKYASLYRRLPEFNDKEKSPKQQQL